VGVVVEEVSLKRSRRRGGIVRWFIEEPFSGGE